MSPGSRGREPEVRAARCAAGAAALAAPLGCFTVRTREHLRQGRRHRYSRSMIGSRHSRGRRRAALPAECRRHHPCPPCCLTPSELAAQPLCSTAGVLLLRCAGHSWHGSRGGACCGSKASSRVSFALCSQQLPSGCTVVEESTDEGRPRLRLPAGVPWFRCGAANPACMAGNVVCRRWCRRGHCRCCCGRGYYRVQRSPSALARLAGPPWPSPGVAKRTRT